MRRRWEINDAQWARLAPLLEPKRRADGRGRPWRDTRQVLNGVLWVLGTGAQWRELPSKYPPYQTCHRCFQHWVRQGVLERILRVLAKELQARGWLDLDEAYVEATFAAAKKGAWVSGLPSAARAPRSSVSPMVTVFLSPSVCRALRRTKVN
jgi:transposase